MNDQKTVDQSSIRTEIVDFVTNNFLFGDRSRLPPDETSLLDSGIIDSTGILELIEFLEDKFSIKVEESETLPANLGSVANILKYVGKKTS